MTRLEVRRAPLRHTLARRPAPARRAGLTWPRLPAAAEVAIVAVGYFGYALVRLAVRAGRHAAFVHAAELWRAERWLHLDAEPSLNHLAAAHPALAETAGYYYGLLHFIVTPLVLAWLYLRRPPAFPRLRSALVLATSAANIVFWTWPAAPPRFSVPGMTDVLVRYHILGAGAPHGPDTLVNLYAAMPSLHVAWATWCAVAVITATRTRWRHLAWLYPAATTVVVLASANHFVLDAAAGAAITAAGLLATRRRAPGHARPGPPRARCRALPGLFPRSAARRWPTDPAGSTRPALLACWPPQRPPAARPRTPKEIGMTTTRTPPPVSPPEQAIALAGPPIRVRLPVGGWQVGFRIQPDGRTVIEVTDQDETLTGLVTSTRLPITSIDAGWSGLTRDPAGGRHWWALAIGHVPADAGQPTVTFTRRTRHRPGVAPPDAVDGLWFAHDGLWVAAATGHHTLARLTTRSATQVRRLRPVTGVDLQRNRNAR